MSTSATNFCVSGCTHPLQVCRRNSDGRPVRTSASVVKTCMVRAVVLAACATSLLLTACASSTSGPACSYRPQTIDIPFITITFETQSGGLDGYYLRRSSYAKFEAGELRGRPTVNELQGSPRGICNIALGANDREVINVDFVATPRRKYYDDPCTPTAEIMNLALRGVGG